MTFLSKPPSAILDFHCFLLQQMLPAANATGATTAATADIATDIVATANDTEEKNHC